jgi:hypothetical protein
LQAYSAVDEQGVDLVGRGVGPDQLVDLGRTGVERAVALELDPRGEARAAEDVLALTRADGIVHETLVDGALELAGFPLLDALVKNDGTRLLCHLLLLYEVSLRLHLLEQWLLLCVLLLDVFHREVVVGLRDCLAYVSDCVDGVGGVLCCGFSLRFGSEERVGGT